MPSSPARTPAPSPIREVVPPSVVNPQAEPATGGGPGLEQGPAVVAAVDAANTAAGAVPPVANSPVAAPQPGTTVATSTALVAATSMPPPSATPYQGLGMPPSFMVPSSSNPAPAGARVAPGAYPLASSGTTGAIVPSAGPPASAGMALQAATRQVAGTIRQPLKPLDAGRSLQNDLQAAADACGAMKRDLELAVQACAVVNELMEVMVLPWFCLVTSRRRVLTFPSPPRRTRAAGRTGGRRS